MYVRTAEAFSLEHENCRNQIIDYALRGKNRGKAYAEQVVRWMLQGTAANLAYNCLVGRIAACEALVAEMDGIIKEGGEFYLVGATPRRFLHSPSGGEFAPATLEQWAEQHLSGLDYIGVVEGAWIGNYTSKPYEQPMISFHFHAQVFGAKRKRVRAAKERLEELDWRSSLLDPGEGVAAYKKLQPGSVESYVRYIMKAPLDEYRLPIPKGEGHRTGAGADRVWKRSMRPGAAVKMMLVIGDAGIEDYLIAGGRGVQVVETALARAREQLSCQEAERQRRIERAVWGA